MEGSSSYSWCWFCFIRTASASWCESIWHKDVIYREAPLVLHSLFSQQSNVPEALTFIVLGDPWHGSREERNQVSLSSNSTTFVIFRMIVIDVCAGFGPIRIESGIQIKYLFQIVKLFSNSCGVNTLMEAPLTRWTCWAEPPPPHCCLRRRSRLWTINSFQQVEVINTWTDGDWRTCPLVFLRPRSAGVLVLQLRG